MSSENIVRTSCETFGCWNECGVLVHVREGKVTEIEGDPNHPYSRGFICPKSKNFAEVLYHPDRVKYPLKRVGERGKGNWKRISWDEALQITADRLWEIRDKYGAQSISGIFQYIPGISYVPMVLFLRSLGSPNQSCCLDKCDAAANVADYLLTGDLLIYSQQIDYEKSKCIVIWGCNPPDSFPNYWRHIREAKDKNGARLIVVDPRRTRAAEKADVWLQIKPGTDGALALSMLNVIISEELYDKQFVEKWTNAPLLVRIDSMKLLRENDVNHSGDTENFVVWDTESEQVKIYRVPRPKDFVGGRVFPYPFPGSVEWPCSKPAIKGSYKVKLTDGTEVECKTIWQLLVDRVNEYSPEVAEQRTWIPAEKIREAARLFATSKPACLHGVRVGIYHKTNCTETSLAHVILVAITGNIDVPGGNIFFKTLKGFRYVFDFTDSEEYRLPSEVEGEGWGTKEFPLVTKYCHGAVNNCYLQKSMLNGGTKALLLWGANPIVTNPNSREHLEGLKKLDFILYCDYFMSPNAEYADIVLPPATWVERNGIKGEVTCRCISVQQKAIEPIGECWDDKKIAFQLARKMEELHREYVPEPFMKWRTAEEWLEHRMKDTGYTFADLKSKGFITFPAEYREYEARGFRTPSGKVELYSAILEKYGYEPLPNYTEPQYILGSNTELDEEYPLILITGSRHLIYYQSSGRYLTWTRKIIPYPTVEIHTQTANSLGIANGEWVWIETPWGRSRLVAEITDKIDSRVVHARHGWYLPEKPAPDHGCLESNINVVTSSDPPYDPVCGSPTFKGLPCRISKVT